MFVTQQQQQQQKGRRIGQSNGMISGGLGSGGLSKANELRILRLKASSKLSVIHRESVLKSRKYVAIFSSYSILVRTSSNLDT